MSDFDRLKQFGYQVGFDLIKEGKQYLEITTTGDRHTFPFACPAEVGVAQFATDLIARMIPEIERLREADSAKSKYIKELRVVNRALNDAQTNNLKRIEGLEKITNNAIGLPFEEDDAVLYGHINMCERVANECLIITTDQIRAAWEQRNHWEKTGVFGAIAIVESVLAEFNIVRCEGCWECDPTIASYMNAPTCNGEGWVKE